MPFADQMRSQLRKFTLPKLREALEQFFARHQRQHRITKEFQLLVVADFVLAFARLLRFLFPRLRAVRDRLFNDGPAPEMVAQPLFQRRDFPFFHRWGQPLFRPAAKIGRGRLSAVWRAPLALVRAPQSQLVLRRRSLSRSEEHTSEL